MTPPNDDSQRDRPERGSSDTSREQHRSAGRTRGERAYSEEFAQAVGHTIKVFRTDLGMARRELADTVGISYSYLTEIENGNKPASTNVLGPIADALGLRLSQLTEAAELRQLNRSDPDALRTPASLHSLVEMPDEQYSQADTRYLSMQPSLRGQHRELRSAILELERLLGRMAPDDIERLLDYARRLSR